MLTVMVALATAIPHSTPPPTACETRACHRRVARRQARASARWCNRRARCRTRVAIKRVTPFPGPDGTRFAIPYRVVACEGGAHGWNVYNREGSGAVGPYQLLGWGAPMPARGRPIRQLAHHRIARRLYLSSGLRPWTESQPCWGR